MKVSDVLAGIALVGLAWLGYQAVSASQLPMLYTPTPRHKPVEPVYDNKSSGGDSGANSKELERLMRSTEVYSPKGDHETATTL
jgi:hypothetical protein